jgi:integrase/recombinase XerD
MALGKQAKILTDKQVRAVLAELDTRRYPLRDRVMFMLSLKSGLRAKEVAGITWAMITDAEGEIGDVISLENRASKGKGGGRHIPMHPDLKAALIALHRDRGKKARPDMPVIHSERDRGLSAAAVVVWFHRLYSGLGMLGCS